MSDRVNPEALFAGLVTATARFVAKTILEENQLASSDAAAILAHYKERGWADVGFPAVAKVAAGMGIDASALQKSKKYNELFVQVLLDEIAHTVDAALRWNQAMPG